MSINSKDNELSVYSLEYPHYLPWHKAIWVVRRGDLIEMEGKVLIVKDVRYKPIPGVLPEVVTEEYVQ